MFKSLFQALCAAFLLGVFVGIMLYGGSAGASEPTHGATGCQVVTDSSGIETPDAEPLCTDIGSPASTINPPTSMLPAPPTTEAPATTATPVEPQLALTGPWKDFGFGVVVGMLLVVGGATMLALSGKGQR